MTQQTQTEDVEFVTEPKIEVYGSGNPPNLVGKYYIWRNGHYVDSDGSNHAFCLQKNGLWRPRNENGTFENMIAAETALNRASLKAVARRYR